MPETIGWFRHAEIKHGRVAMAAFVGYTVQSNGICFPWNLQGPFGATMEFPAISFADVSAAGGPADQWDALPTAAKLQILGVVGFLEMWSETSAALELDGQKHYVRGGKPGYFPSLKGRFPHPVPLNLWDPFGFTAKMTPERKEKALLAEVNNGRLAMIGIFGYIPASSRTLARSWRRSRRATPACRTSRTCSPRSARSATRRAGCFDRGLFRSTCTSHPQRMLR